MIDPLQDNKSSIELVDFMGGDLAVVNAARVSYNRQTSSLSSRDINLIRFLIDPPSGKSHTSPLRSTVFVFRVKAPLFVCRQWWKHHIASSHCDEQDSWNERSFRYSEITEEDDYYVPKKFHAQSTINKQKSGEPLKETKDLHEIYDTAAKASFMAYRKLLGMGVSREEARGVLPVCQYTSFVWTTSLQAALNFVDLRKGDGAQWEIMQYAQAVEQIIEEKCKYAKLFWSLKNERDQEAIKLWKWITEQRIAFTADEVIQKLKEQNHEDSH